MEKVQGPLPPGIAAPPYPGPPMGVYQAQPYIQSGKTTETFNCVLSHAIFSL